MDITKDLDTEAEFTGKTIIPGTANKQCSYRSKLGGLFSIIMMVEQLCKYYNISQGDISIVCDGLGPFNQCFEK